MFIKTLPQTRVYTHQISVLNLVVRKIILNFPYTHSVAQVTEVLFTQKNI